MLITLYMLIASLTASGFTGSEAAPPDHLIIPQPASVELGNSFLNISRSIRLTATESNPDMERVIVEVRSWLGEHSVRLSDEADAPQLRLIIDPDRPPEYYQLDINPQGINLTGGSSVGLFYGVQTLRQLGWSEPVPQGIRLRTAMIRDEPAFGYRGMHLDVGRHMFPVEAIKQYIDMLARYKMNRFHWHLTEDQGWRIEIKKYPKLQEVAAYRKETLIGHYNDQPHQFDGRRYGGYYTQEEVKEIVAYAKDRFITVIPEIELPGHAQAAVAAYPELGCTDEPVEVATKWGVFDNIYCPNEETFQFLEDVLTEVMALFPSRYIHIGGDEAPKTQWEHSEQAQAVIRREGLADEHELQSYFIRRIEAFLNKNGRSLIGWDEILEGGLAPNATVMSWRGEAGGIAAAKQGHDVIMTPTTYCYFDYYQSTHPDEPLAIGGFLPLEKVYGYHPIPDELSAEEAKHILGAQGNIWTEYIPTVEKLHYMAYPRMQALAEVVWTPRDQKDLQQFVHRLDGHYPHFDKWGIQAANHLYDAQVAISNQEDSGLQIVAGNLVDKGQIRYEFSGDNSSQDQVYRGPFKPRSGTYTFQSYRDNEMIGRPASITYEDHLAVGQTMTLKHAPHPKYNGEQPQVILNGVVGSDERYGDSEWIGLEGVDFDAEITWEKPVAPATVQLRFYHSPGQWIYAPREVTFYAWSGDVKDWVKVASATVEPTNKKISSLTFSIPKAKKNTRFRLEIPNYGTIPEGAQGAGHGAWLFVDELRIR